jgi:hypothetical protein
MHVDRTGPEYEREKKVVKAVKPDGIEPMKHGVVICDKVIGRKGRREGLLNSERQGLSH